MAAAYHLARPTSTFCACPKTWPGPAAFCETPLDNDKFQLTLGFDF
jgi:hypothetical protein